MIAWDRLVEHIAENARKGDRVIVYGRLEQREWTTEAGETRTVWEITAEDLGLSLRLPPARGGAEGTRATPKQSVPEQYRATAEAVR